MENTKKKNLAIIFPGMGYNSNKPLLYYSKNLAENLGFETIEVDYGTLPKGDLKAAFEHAMNETRKSLKEQGVTDFNQYDKILFLAKSIGTAVSGTLANKLIHEDSSISSKLFSIYLTPVKHSLPMLCGNGIVFHGTSDTWVETQDVIDTCQDLSMSLYTTDQADHSMETGDVITDLDNMKTIMEHCKEYIESILINS
ncbi:hypothetical protein [Anaerosporobacter sp.]